jgi:hypothetical protein
MSSNQMKVGGCVLGVLFLFVESDRQVNVAPLLLPALVGTVALIALSATLYTITENRRVTAPRLASSQWL